ncbi:hypothetical protein ACET98_23080, partial [Aeromonas veronii]
MDQGQKKREETMPWQHVADRNAAVQCHLWRNALFGSMQQQLEMKKPARGVFQGSCRLNRFFRLRVFVLAPGA